MGLGLSKGFIVAVVFGLLAWYGFKDPMAFVWIVGTYAVIKIIWNILTKK